VLELFVLEPVANNLGTERERIYFALAQFIKGGDEEIESNFPKRGYVPPLTSVSDYS